MRLLVLLAALLLLVGCNVKPAGILPPPKDYRGAGPAPGTLERDFATMEALRKACADWGVAPGQPYSIFASANKRVNSCYIPALNAEFLPAPGVVPDGYRAELKDHEDYHSRGAVHPVGHDDVWVVPATFVTKRMFGAR